MQAIRDVFSQKLQQKKPVFIPFLTAGYPTLDATVPLLLALEKGGADIIELGVPFSDPLADGPTIQESNNVALKAGVTVSHVMTFVREARSAGLRAPLILMGYANPILAYGEERFVRDTKTAGANGVIVVDFPFEESVRFRQLCMQNQLANIPLVAPTTTDERLIKLAASQEHTFIYCISLLGVTGGRSELPRELPDFIGRVRKHIPNVPLAVGFGISTKAHFDAVSSFAEAIVVGSKIIQVVREQILHKRNNNTKENEKELIQSAANALKEFVSQLVSNSASSFALHNNNSNNNSNTNANNTSSNLNNESIQRLPSHFGEFGGRYAPETLMQALDELEVAYARARADPTFEAEIRSYATYVGRPTPLYFAERLTAFAGGAHIWLKREDLAHTGAHKINNAVGQAILAKRLGKTRIIAETGAGQHGVATATICAKFGFKCRVYMGSEDVERQSLNVFRMKILGAEVVPVESGQKTLKDAINEAMRDWVTNIKDTHYLVGSAIGPHPFPTIVRDLQSIIGKESRSQFMDKMSGKLPDVVMACVGGGSNAIGMFHPFVNDVQVKIVGVEAAGAGLHTQDHCATIVKGTPGVLHGTRTLLLQDRDGQIAPTHSISAGLDYPGVGPEHAHLSVSGRAKYVGVDDKQALEGFQLLAKHEGIIPALESSHAIYHAVQLAKQMDKSQHVVVCLSGRGDKDLGIIAKALGVTLK